MSETIVLELPLATTPAQEHALDVRFMAGKFLYNACLGESLNRLKRLRHSVEWKQARALPKSSEKAKAFRTCVQKYGFSNYDLQAFSTKTKNACWIGQHLDAHTTQKIASRAFAAAERYLYRKGGTPRFKRRFDTLGSLEGKSNASGIRWRTDHVEWGGLTLRGRFDPKDKHGVQTSALQQVVKYCRIVKRTIKGRARYFVQLVLSGLPKQKKKPGPGVVGLDLGPSSVALVSSTTASLEVFCPGVAFPAERLRRLQRALDRSRRANNPDNYRSDGTIKPGPKTWVVSAGYLRLRQAIAECQRVLAARRITEQGTLVNQVLSEGATIKTEKLTYTAFQKSFGRSVRDRAPGTFMTRLRHKAESAGGKVVEFSTRTTKLSQTCHCGNLAKKPLSQRWHQCAVCGAGPVQRDLYSAFLSLWVDPETETLDIRQAQHAWPGAESLLLGTISRLEHESANGRVFPASFGLKRQRRSGSAQEGALSASRSKTCQSLGRAAESGTRTPRL